VSSSISEVHIVTVGTSVLRNAQGLVSEKCRDEIRRLLSSTEGGEAGSLSPRCREEVKEALPRNPYSMSAELNAMKNFLEKNSPREKNSLRRLSIVLYATDTVPGQVAAGILKEYLSSVMPNARIMKKTVQNLGKNFWDGIVHLMREIITDVKRFKSKHATIYINATGGFKPETAAAIIAASLAGAHAVYYIHERMRQPVWIPLIPLRVDKGILTGYIGQLELMKREWCGRRPRVLKAPLTSLGGLAAILLAAGASGAVRLGEERPGEYHVEVDCSQVDYLISFLETLRDVLADTSSGV